MDKNLNQKHASNTEPEASVVQNFYTVENTKPRRIKIFYVVLGFFAVCLVAVVAFYLWAYGYMYRAQVTLENTKEEIIQIGDITRYKDSLYGFDEGNNVYIAPGYKFESDIRVNDPDFIRIEGLSARNFEVIGDKVGRVGDEIYFGGEKVTHNIKNSAIFAPLIDGDELGVYFLDEGQIWYVGDGPWEAIVVSNPESFREISLPNNWTNHHFITNGEISYLNTDRIYIDDPDSFQQVYPSAEDCIGWVPCEKVTNNWYKDSESVYYNGVRVLDADPVMFAVPQRDLNKGRIAVDANFVFDAETRGVQDRKYIDICESRITCYFDLKYPGINSDGFRIAKAIGNFDTGIFSTSEGTYNAAGKKISDAVSGEFELLGIPNEVCESSGAYNCSSPWSRDKDLVYYNDEVVSGADPDTFEIIPEKAYSLDYDRFQYSSRCGKDATAVYCQLNRVNNVDLDTFESLAENIYRDKDNVYVTYFGVPHTPVTELDVDTFQINFEKNRKTGCDKNGCYWIAKDSVGKSDKEYLIYKNIDGNLTLIE